MDGLPHLYGNTAGRKNRINIVWPCAEKINPLGAEESRRKTLLIH